MAADARDDELAALEARIAAVREARRPKRSAAADKFDAASIAWRMVTELVVGVLLGAAIGWGIDSAIGTLPAFLIVFALLGFAAGVKVMMRSAEEMRRRGAGEERPAPDARRERRG